MTLIPTPRVLFVSALAMFVGLLASGVALLLTRLIGFVTNIAFYGRVSTSFTSSPLSSFLVPPSPPTGVDEPLNPARSCRCARAVAGCAR